MFLSKALEITESILKSKPKKERKKIGQFFTSKETAVFMSSLFDLSDLTDTVTILDPGSGTGILSAALLDRLEILSTVNNIHLICYENDKTVLQYLQKTLEFIRLNSSKDFSFEIRDENFILSMGEDFEAGRSDPEYDLVIANPPYKKISKESAEAQAVKSIIYGQPNLYFIFTALALSKLKENAQMSVIIPRSWTSGVYFRKFREYLLSNAELKYIHLFVERDKVFSQEQVKQETIILNLIKTRNTVDEIIISTSRSNSDFEEISKIKAKYSSIVTGDEHYVFLPINDNEINTLNKINSYTHNLQQLGIRMRTGIVVDFRQKDELRSHPDRDTVPLFRSSHIRNGIVNHTLSDKGDDWITVSKETSLQENHNYLFCKRFASKEESRRLQFGIFLSENLPEYSHIATDNKINFIEMTDGTELPEYTLYGLYALFNSTMYDSYYRILNGSTQVNSTEINEIPVPTLEVIKKMGSYLIKSSNFSTAYCDTLLEMCA